jgi:DNA-directed RNA polymerase II subunit RPB1
VAQQSANQRGGRPVKGISQRLEKKEGRVRGNLMGKRTDFTGRTVITPDPDLELDQIGVPYVICMNLTFPEPVNNLNYERLSKCVKIGPWDMGGANWIVKEDGTRIDLRVPCGNDRAQDRDKIVLQIGRCLN